MTDPKDLRKRLDALNRKPLPESTSTAAEVTEIRRRIQKLQREGRQPSAEPILYRREIPRQEARPRPPRLPMGPHVALEEAARGMEVRAPHGGKAYVIAGRLEEVGDLHARLLEAFGSAFGQGPPAQGLFAQDVVFLDLETTGLAATPLFLIGTMVWEDAGPLVQQYFARTYAEERAVISLFLHDVAQRKVLVSFNGKSFDVPYVRVRAAANGVPFALPLGHIDLLHQCRRAWPRMLPDYRLRTLESCICGRIRHDDIPGSEIPDAYHAFVRTGNAVQIAQILQHNVLDLVTLAELMARLALTQ